MFKMSNNYVRTLNFKNLQEGTYFYSLENISQVIFAVEISIPVIGETNLDSNPVATWRLRYYFQTDIF